MMVTAAMGSRRVCREGTSGDLPLTFFLLGHLLVPTHLLVPSHILVLCPGFYQYPERHTSPLPRYLLVPKLVPIHIQVLSSHLLVPIHILVLCPAILTSCSLCIAVETRCPSMLSVIITIPTWAGCLYGLEVYIRKSVQFGQIFLLYIPRPTNLGRSCSILPENSASLKDQVQSVLVWQIIIIQLNSTEVHTSLQKSQ